MGDSPLHSILLRPAAATAAGYVHAVETFGAADGPGLRYVLFTAGCRMRCLYCHNPDSWTMRDGQQKTAEEVVEDIGRYSAFYRRTGGLTVSGGEPLMQPDFVGAVFKQVKQLRSLALDERNTVSEICQTLGISRATFYRYVKN